MDKEVSLITKYVGVWGWMLISIMFLISTFIMFALPRTNLTAVFGTSFFLIFGVTQFVATKRRRELQNEQTR